MDLYTWPNIVMTVVSQCYQQKQEITPYTINCYNECMFTLRHTINPVNFPFNFFCRIKLHEDDSEDIHTPVYTELYLQNKFSSLKNE